MTLIVAALGKKSIWMMADRRISFAQYPARDDARKIVKLETFDGSALLGYAGLGCTELGSEPSDWMANCLHGANLSLENSLTILSIAAFNHLPKHLSALRLAGDTTHSICIAALCENEPRFYSIDLARANGQALYCTRFVRHSAALHGTKSNGPRVSVCGSGQQHLVKDSRWARDLLNLIKAHEAGRISAQTVASSFSQINLRVARSERTVSENCIVAWQYASGGGSQATYDGPIDSATERNKSNRSFSLIGSNGTKFTTFYGQINEQQTKAPLNPVPTIARGADINSLLQVTIDHVFLPMVRARRANQEPQIDHAAMKADLAKIATTPNDKLK